MAVASHVEQVAAGQLAVIAAVCMSSLYAKATPVSLIRVSVVSPVHAEGPW